MLKQRGYVDWDLIVFFIGMALVILTGALGGLSLARAGCRNSAEVMGVEYKWGATIGCMVKVDGRYYPLGAIRYANGKVKVEASE